MSFRRSGAALLAAALVFGVAGSVSAQEAVSERPFRGLFGAGDARPGGQSLALDWRLLGAYDNSSQPADTMTSTGDPTAVVNGAHGGATGALTYAARGEHRSFTATGTSTGRYYPDVDSLNGFEGGTGLSFVSDLGRRTRINLGQTFSYQPYYSINFLNSVVPSAAEPVDSGSQSDQVALTSRSSYGLDGRFEITESIGARSSIRADYGYRSMRFGGSDETFNWRVANVTFLRNLTRNATLRAGYGYGVGHNTLAMAAPSIVNHNLDLGIDYNRQLSFSRHTRVNFSSGSAAVVDQGSTTYRLIGTANITQEIRRTWHAGASYDRGVQYLPGFGEMFFSDTVQVRAAGLLQRRIEAGVTGGFSSGQVGLEKVSSYSSSTAGADLRIAMSRTLSFFTQYTYYRYGFDNSVQVPFNLAPQLDRQTFRIGISGWLPLVR